MANHKVETTASDIDSAIERAAHLAGEPRARSAEYLSGRGLDLVILHMTDGRRCVLPREELQGLENGTPEQLSRIELLGAGTGLHWPDLDADLYVPALLQGIYGTPRWMQALNERPVDRDSLRNRVTAAAA